ncbi:MAG: Holliday junction resolvase RuvX [Clostridia bacterium]|nr:Holliday junction resolvase RuvX [Clostridia bacterium]
MRMFGIDLGERRTGVATCDEREVLASAFAVLQVKGLNDTIKQLVPMIEREKPGKIVVGLPLCTDGTRGEKATRAEAFCDMLRDKVDVEVVLWDERYSTVEAYSLLHEVGRNEKDARKNIDAVAASLILQSYLDASKK